jgi:hypothetical protein
MKGEIALRNLLTGNKATELRYFGTNVYRTKHKRQRQSKKTEIRLEREVEVDICGMYRLLKRSKKINKNSQVRPRKQNEIRALKTKRNVQQIILNLN